MVALKSPVVHVEEWLVVAASHITTRAEFRYAISSKGGKQCRGMGFTFVKIVDP